MTGAFTGGPASSGGSFYSGRFPLGVRGGVVDGGEQAGESFMHALFEDYIISYSGHTYHPPGEPDNGPFSDLKLCLGSGTSVLDINPTMILTEVDTGDGMAQAKLVYLQSCYGFLKPTGQPTSLGGACVGKGAQAVIGYGHSVWLSVYTTVESMVWEKMAVECKDATTTVTEIRQELLSQHGQEWMEQSGVDGLLARPVGTTSTIAPAPLSCPAGRHH